MKVYYATDPVGGKLNIIRVLYDREVFSTPINIGYPFDVLEVDEIDGAEPPENKDICRNLVDSMSKVDAVGEARYYVLINGSGPELFEKENWEEVVDA